jgi:predicted acetyltransferase
MAGVSVRDSRRSREDRSWIEGIYRDYLNDLAPHATGVYPALGEFGHSVPDQVLGRFADSHAQILTILFADKPVCFAMVHARASVAGLHSYAMAEFFIAAPWRRRGIGGEAVRLILDRFTGHWEITELLRNTAAVNFWRDIVNTYTGGRYQERILNGEVIHRFESGGRRPR